MLEGHSDRADTGMFDAAKPSACYSRPQRARFIGNLHRQLRHTGMRSISGSVWQSGLGGLYAVVMRLELQLVWAGSRGDQRGRVADAGACCFRPQLARVVGNLHRQLRHTGMRSICGSVRQSGLGGVSEVVMRLELQVVWISSVRRDDEPSVISVTTRRRCRSS